jgi:hypothetical protein
LINERLSNISISIGAIDDVDITTPVGDGSILVASGGIFENQTSWTMGTGGRIIAQDGSGTLPSYGFANDTDAGMWLEAAGALRISVSNTGGLRISSGTVRCEGAGSEALPALTVGAEIDTGFYEPSANHLGFTVQGDRVLEMLDNAGIGVNYFELQPSATTVPMALTAAGTDTDIDIDIQPKGAGVVRSDRQVSGPTTSVTAATHTHADGERYLLCDTSSNAITVNLVAAATAGDGYRLDIKSVDATNNVTIDGSGSETIDGATTAVLTTQYENISLVCDGSNWHIL